jgi:maleate isomerase
MNIAVTITKSQGLFRRGKIGLIVPSSNTICEMDFHRLAPEGVSVHTARMMTLAGIKGTADWQKPMNWDEEYKGMYEKCEEAAIELATARVDIIVFGCTSGSFTGGPGFDKELCRKIEKAVVPICGKIPAITASTAVVEALKELKVKSVSMVTPYPQEINERGKVFLEGNGFKVVDEEGLNLEAFSEFARQEPQVIYDLARKADKRDADAIFISCTEFRSLDVIEVLEKDLRKPVISANQASLWLALKKLEINESIKGYGTLLLGQFG